MMAHEMLSRNTGNFGGSMQQVEFSRYDLAFASFPEPTLLIDKRGCFVSANAAAEAFLGKMRGLDGDGEAVERALPWLVGPVLEVLQGAEEASIEAHVSTPAGGRWIVARVRRVGEPHQPSQGALVVLEDVTERREDEAHRRSVERLASIGSIATGLAHEASNPLACVVAGLSFLESEYARVTAESGAADLDEARLALDDIRDAAKRMGRIVLSLQSFGSPCSSLMGPTRLSVALQEALELVGPQLRTRARLSAEISDPVEVKGNGALLVEAFEDLLQEALEAIPPGRPEVNEIQVNLLGSPEEARVVISHTGPSGTGKRLRGADRISPRSDGMDDSPPVSRGIVTALGGSIVLDCTPYAGTTVIVTLPRG